jgi:hypothetical protein
LEIENGEDGSKVLLRAGWLTCKILAMKSRLMLSTLAFSIASTSAFCHEKPVQDCKVTFAVVYLDRLNNTNNGIPAKSVKDVEKKTE